jgi:hypothetical protein
MYNILKASQAMVGRFISALIDGFRFMKLAKFM